MIRRPPSRRFYLIGGAVALAGFGVAVAASFLGSMLGFTLRAGSLPRAVMPGAVQLELPAGNYTGYYEARSQLNGRTYLSGSLDLYCRLTGPSGIPIELRRSSANFTYSTPSYSGQSTLVFRAPQDGRYTLTCDSHQPNHGQVVIAIGRGPHWSAAVLVVAGICALAAGMAVCLPVYRRRRSWARTEPYRAGAEGPPTASQVAGAGWPLGPDAPGEPTPTIGRPEHQPAVSHPAQSIALASAPVPGQAPPGSAVAAPAAQPPRGSGLAVTALVFALLGGMVVAIPLAIVSLVQSRTGPRRGRGIALAALAVSGEWVLVAAVALIAAVLTVQPGRVLAATAFSASAAPSGQPTTAGTEIDFADLRVGHCVESRPGPPVDSLTRVSCTLPHELEVTAIPDLGSGPWPGEKTLQTRAGGLCSAAFQSYVGTPIDRSELDLIWYTPDEDGWRQGDHTIDCFASDPAVKTTGTVRGSHR